MGSYLDKNGFYECSTCHGGGISKNKSSCIRLLEVCPRCSGSGKLDWVSNIMDNKNIDSELFHTAAKNAVLSNIKVLQQRIIDEGLKIGIQVKLNMEFKDMREMQLHTSPLMIPGRFKNV